MKILVFGAGVLGCNLARNFLRAGKDITLLARGAWGESIQKKRPSDQGQVFAPHVGQPHSGHGGAESGGQVRRDLRRPALLRCTTLKSRTALPTSAL